MKLFLYTTLLFVLSCEQPTSQRLGPTFDANLASDDNLEQNPNLNNESNQNNDAPKPNTNNQNELPAGFSNCNQDDLVFAPGIGNMNICQSTNDERQIRILFAQSDPTARTCMIPTFKDSMGSSTYLGQPQCLFQEQDKAQIGMVYKNRPGFSQYPINGVMIMKENAIDDYFKCMNAYATFQVLPQCPYGAVTSQACDLLARSHMSNLCQQFQSRHSYIDTLLN